MCKRVHVILALCLSGLILVGCASQTGGELQSVVIEEKQSQEVRPREIICVHVCGFVKHPGVYELPIGSRIYQAIEKAGGFRKQADTTGLNQAELLDDGVQIYIPSKAETKKNSESISSKVNINTASKEELMTLTGIGEAKAEAIIAYRDKHGKFKKIDDIMNISGIKEGMFAKIEGDITV